MAEVDLVLKWQQSVSQGRYADDQLLVSRLYAVCSDFYAELVSQIGADQNTDPSLLLRLQRSHSYLILWADGYGVAQGQLDSSLDRSRRAKQSTINLLISICQTLTKRLLPTLGREQQLRLQDRATDITQKVELLKLVASQDDAEDFESDTESESSQNSDTAVELDEIAEDLKTDTECLLDLGSRFKEEAVGPVLKETAVDPDELVDWDPSHTFIDRVRWRYPKCEVEVARRLGRANWSRVLRQQTIKDVSLIQVEPRTSEAVESTARSHVEQDSAKGSENSKKAASSEATATSFRDSALGSSVPSDLSPSRTNNPEAQDIHYAETTVSYYGEHGDVVRIPSLPVGAKDGHPFLCLSCNTNVTATTKSLWKKHLFMDLKPYMCLVNTCGLNEKQFATKSEWKAHLDLKHPSGQDSNDLKCPICQDDTFTGDEHYSTHLAKHMEEVALTILPTNADSEDGTDADSGLASSEHSQCDGNQETEPVAWLSTESDGNHVMAKNIWSAFVGHLYQQEDLATFRAWLDQIENIFDFDVVLRDVEVALLHMAEQNSQNAGTYQKSALAVLNTISKMFCDIDEASRVRPGERPYDEEYFLHAEKEIRRKASSMTHRSHRSKPLHRGQSDTLAEGLDAEAQERVLNAVFGRSTRDGLFVAPMVCKEPGCGKEFKRPCDLTKHETTHRRPWKCPISTCKYREYGWPTEKELDRHWKDKHEEAPAMYECLFKPCPYKSKRESNCKQHMEKIHGWTYVRTKTNGMVHESAITMPSSPYQPSETTPYPGYNGPPWPAEGAPYSLPGDITLTPQDVSQTPRVTAYNDLLFGGHDGYPNDSPTRSLRRHSTSSPSDEMLLPPLAPNNETPLKLPSVAELETSIDTTLWNDGYIPYSGRLHSRYTKDGGAVPLPLQHHVSTDGAHRPENVARGDHTTREAPHSTTSQAFYPDSNQDWMKISDIAERRRIQNRIAQRNYRKKLKRRLEDLEKRANSSKDDDVAKGNPSTNSSTSSQASSYWSPKEASDFPHLLSAFGSDWAGLAAHMGTKTPVMVKNYYLRQKENGDNHWEELVNVANGKRSRGESLPVPPYSRGDILEGADAERNEVLGTERYIVTMKYPKRIAKTISRLLALASKK